MPSLDQVQREFASAIFHASRPVPAGVGSNHGGAANKRFAVYRNNVVMSLTDVVAAFFPVVARLLGGDFFRATARAFILERPPASPVLTRYGAELPEFLSEFRPVTDLPYLPDVARLEWMQQRAYHAANARPLTRADLSHVEPDEVPRLCFLFHPSAQIQRSRFPVFSIWRTNTFDEDVKFIPAEAAGEAVLVSRVGLEVKALLLDPGFYTFFEALMAGVPLGEAAMEASREASAFDFQKALAALLDLGAVYGHGAS
ncbi:MAG: putative DNA-binding domain-containing protein [Hyphomicrobiaceae bacterium]|nr:putative DNA-binding domain-containing protein [Hyphomicrobiaceae bacterium]